MAEQMKEEWFRCECGCGGISVAYWADDGVFYFSTYKGPFFRAHSLKTKLNNIWKMITLDRVECDDMVLSEESLIRLKGFIEKGLKEFSEDPNRLKGTYG